jgi:hypothetical protein
MAQFPAKTESVKAGIPECEKREWPTVLIYKRTHTGDPGPDGIFGCRDCMGRVRGYGFDAVIGIGGTCRMARKEGIAGLVTWVGTGAHREQLIRSSNRGPLVTFDKFVLLDQRGLELRSVAPMLARYFFSKHRRYMLSDGLDDDLQAEIDEILRLTDSQPRNHRPAYTAVDAFSTDNCAPQSRCRRGCSRNNKGEFNDKRTTRTAIVECPGSCSAQSPNPDVRDCCSGVRSSGPEHR